LSVVVLPDDFPLKEEEVEQNNAFFFYCNKPESHDAISRKKKEFAPLENRCFFIF
jgi:hypothetical protein